MSSSSQARTIVPFLPRAARGSRASRAGLSPLGRAEIWSTPTVGNASTDNGSRPPNLLTACSMLVRMDERQKIRDDLARHLTFRKLTTDEQAREAIDERIREIEDRLRRSISRKLETEVIGGADEIDPRPPRNPRQHRRGPFDAHRPVQGLPAQGEPQSGRHRCSLRLGPFNTPRTAGRTHCSGNV
jgi:hypothetical protein